MLKISKMMIDRWSEMTDINQHNELRLEVAECFEKMIGQQFSGYVVFFKEVLKQIEEDNHIDIQLSLLKERILSRMLNEASFYIENIEDVNKCF